LTSQTRPNAPLLMSFRNSKSLIVISSLLLFLSFLFFVHKKRKIKSNNPHRTYHFIEIKNAKTISATQAHFLNFRASNFKYWLHCLWFEALVAFLDDSIGVISIMKLWLLLFKFHHLVFLFLHGLSQDLIEFFIVLTACPCPPSSLADWSIFITLISAAIFFDPAVSLLLEIHIQIPYLNTSSSLANKHHKFV